MKEFTFPVLVIFMIAAGCLSCSSAATGRPPVINSFDVTPGNITSGESSTLSWSVSDAKAVSIDQGIGNVALSGTRVLSPNTTTTYTLTATNDAGSATATAQVVASSGSEAQPETVSEHTVTLYSIAAEDGNVRERPKAGFHLDDPIVGDDMHNKARQAFLSFDISGIPAGATIKSAFLDVRGSKEGKPFANLGLLGVYNHQYGSLTPFDFTPDFPTGYMKSYSSPPAGPFSNSALIGKVQARVNAGDSRFQVRLQFQKHTDNNGKIDALGVGNPRLVITYEE